VPGGQLALFRRFIRWFNLTVLQAIRPLMIVLFNSPRVDIGETSCGWWRVRGNNEQGLTLRRSCHRVRTILPSEAKPSRPGMR
jgi:hypothetical protein